MKGSIQREGIDHPNGMSTLAAENLAELSGGYAGLAINAALAAALKDTEDRGHEDEKERKVVITIGFKKVTDDGDVRIGCKVKTSIPDYQTGDTVALLKSKRGGRVDAEFRPSNPERHDQPTILDAAEVGG